MSVRSADTVAVRALSLDHDWKRNASDSRHLLEGGIAQPAQFILEIMAQRSRWHLNPQA
jgi:hypothetical protein